MSADARKRNPFRGELARAAILLLVAAGCAELGDSSEEDPAEQAEIDSVDSSGWSEADDSMDLGDSRALEDLEAPSPLGRNADATTVVVWSQNIRMGLEAWPNIVRCMRDRACNGLGAVPDIILLQEASCANVRAMQSKLAAPRNQGGLGISSWKHFCADNAGSGGVTGHWLSNGIIYRSDRFRLERAANALRVPFYSGDGTTCAKEGRVLPVLKLLDLRRANAGYLEQRVTVAVRHDDHFGGGVKNTCPAANASTEFCAWKNSKVIDQAIAKLGGGLLVMGGDWNFAAKHCIYDGAPSTGFKYAYACTTAGVRSDCAPANLGWRDPILESDPTFYDDRTVIDFLHGKDMGGASLNETNRNYLPGIVGEHFYCDGHGAYARGGDADHPQRMSDHHARLMRFHY